jgi:N-succinyldiaminopimelate aminotransferase
MNPDLRRLQPYPFEKLRALLQGVRPNPAYSSILLSLGEPKHPTPAFICQALADHLTGLSTYPPTIGKEDLRRAIAAWLLRRYRLSAIDHQTQVIPTLGSREAIFALAQVVIDPSARNPVAVLPNPFYQIYEGAILLAGASPHYINTVAEHGFRMDLGAVPESVWARTQLVFTCSPGNPTGHVMSLEEWQELFELSDRYGFVVAADECYSEIYLDNARPPLGALEAAQLLGRSDFRRLVSLGSLSKRSNAPGMRSGYAAGDVAIIKDFTLYRTYNGSAMSPAIQAASQAAWEDEAHVLENRRLYREKFAAVYDVLNPVLPLVRPDATFYYWVETPMPDTDFAVRLFRDYRVTVLPGSLLAREAGGINPGRNHVRIALVAAFAECIEAAQRVRNFVSDL